MAGGGVPFAAGADQYSIQQTSSLIKTFTERVDDETMLERMRQEINGAECLIYLGFSFGQMNMDLLRIQHGNGPEKEIFGTAYNMSDWNALESRSRIFRSLTVDGKTLTNDVTLKNLTANQLLLDLWYKLSG
ncbi:hypothetical protein NOI24_22475 [Neorhizobium galegae]|uniref:hypothetical protein n=1 Tax=Neorhizobium galegae TaxID=399 RepID=UPI002104BE14|nr:hypothetical protein [Neorhizobium galegae]MCQ1774087.1 hypothetical protein [Neorhizobium galegae]MCQ1800132.1 hypothetical protein [Neorhizobium galegae]